MACRYAVYHSYLGDVIVVAQGDQIVTVGLNESLETLQKNRRRLAAEPWQLVEPAHDALLGRALAALREYFETNAAFPANLPLETAGTPFQQSVWQALCSIPHGKTSTYGEIAKRIGKPKAARAVGAACGANPIPLFIPCHRVLAGDGGLGGFGGGLDLKEQLLTLEALK